LSNSEFSEKYWPKIVEENNFFVFKDISVFDPMLCDVTYRWFCPHGGIILDPFAGGCVRGIIASIMGFSYYGVDLQERQCKENAKQAIELGLSNCTWIAGDSNNILSLLEPVMDTQVDFIFTCPPYFNLEIYSDDTADLSAMESYSVFIKVYGNILINSCKKLKDNRFAGIVVSNFRDDAGYLLDFIGDTISILGKVGLRLYNQIIYLQQAGSAPLRAGPIFKRSRKVMRTHQELLIFYKGQSPNSGLAEPCFNVPTNGDPLQKFLSRSKNSIGLDRYITHIRPASKNHQPVRTVNNIDNDKDNEEISNYNSNNESDPIFRSLYNVKVKIEPIQEVIKRYTYPENIPLSPIEEMVPIKHNFSMELNDRLEDLSDGDDSDDNERLTIPIRQKKQLTIVEMLSK